MDNLRELYQEVILDHNRSPRNFHKMADCSCQAQGYNPLCGDELTLYLKMQDDVIESISFEGKGCAISTASASLLTESLIGKSKAQAQALFDDIHALFTKATPANDIGKLQVLAGVNEFPARVKCATLAWHTLLAALENSTQPITTE